MTLVLLAAVGSGLGAALRFSVHRIVSARLRSPFPWATLAVNVVGAFGLGVLAGSTGSSAVTTLVGVGGFGGLTTVSTFGYETVRLFRSGSWLLGAANALVTVVLGILAAAAGVALSSRLA